MFVPNSGVYDNAVECAIEIGRNLAAGNYAHRGHVSRILQTSMGHTTHMSCTGSICFSHALMPPDLGSSHQLRLRNIKIKFWQGIRAVSGPWETWLTDSLSARSLCCLGAHPRAWGRRRCRALQPRSSTPRPTRNAAWRGKRTAKRRTGAGAKLCGTQALKSSTPLLWIKTSLAHPGLCTAESLFKQKKCYALIR